MPQRLGLLAALKLLMLMADSGYRSPLNPGLPSSPLLSYGGGGGDGCWVGGGGGGAGWADAGMIRDLASKGGAATCHWARLQGTVGAPLAAVSSLRP